MHPFCNVSTSKEYRADFHSDILLRLRRRSRYNSRFDGHGRSPVSVSRSLNSSPIDVHATEFSQFSAVTSLLKTTLPIFFNKFVPPLNVTSSTRSQSVSTSGPSTRALRIKLSKRRSTNNSSSVGLGQLEDSTGPTSCKRLNKISRLDSTILNIRGRLSSRTIPKLYRNLQTMESTEPRRMETPQHSSLHYKEN
jgi:hypothetical protein